MSDEEIAVYMTSMPEQFECQECSEQCHPGSTYQTFSTSPSICLNSLICDKVHVPPLDLPKLEFNFCELVGEKDEFWVHPEDC